MGSIADILLSLSKAFLFPVIGVLLALLGWTLLQLGGLLAEFLTRRPSRKDLTQFIERLKRDSTLRVTVNEIPANYGLPKRAATELATSEGCHEKTLDDLQLRAEAAMARLTFGVRIAPLLGLAGTLIPLGPALLALSQGKFEQLAYRLIVAFTTTVLGLLIGGGCYAIYSVRRTWYTQDLNDIQFVMERLTNETTTTNVDRRSVRPASGRGQPV